MSAHSYKSESTMSRGMVLIIVSFAILATWCVFLTIQIWQLQENQAKLLSMLYKQQGQLEQERDERHKESNEFQRQSLEVYSEVKGDVKKLAGQYDHLYQMVLRNKEEARDDVQHVLHLQIDLTSNVVAIKKDQETNVARIDNKMDDNQKKVNDSMRGLAELFVDEITKLENKIAKYENETWLIGERVKQLEATAREPVMIENKVHVETEYHHHHPVVQYREPQLTLGERIGKFIGGVVQNGVSSLLSTAMGIIGLS